MAARRCSPQESGDGGARHKNPRAKSVGKVQPTVAEWRTTLFGRVTAIEGKMDAMLSALAKLTAGMEAVAHGTAQIPRLAAAVDDIDLRMGELEEIIPESPDPFVRHEEGARPSEFNAIADNLQLRGALEGEDAEAFLSRRGFVIVKTTRTGAPLNRSAWLVKNIRLVSL
jgi:hypothetical protein